MLHGIAESILPVSTLAKALLVRAIDELCALRVAYLGDRANLSTIKESFLSETCWIDVF
jgi:hypothetical protein